MTIERWRTALRRSSHSKPIKLALRDGVIRKDTSVLDYGCGRGDDVHRLRQQGVWARGWDPHFGSTPPVVKSDVVNLGYVLNAIEDEMERRKTIERAWRLARGVLVIAVRTDRIDGKPFRDGVLTKAGTFQKSYKGWDLNFLVERTFNALPREVQYYAYVNPGQMKDVGILYLFRTKKLYEQYQARKDARPSRRANNKPLSGQKEKV